MDITAMEVYRVGGKYYSTLVNDNGGHTILGKQLIDAIPEDPDTFQGEDDPYRHSEPPLTFKIAWKCSKIQHFVEEDLRLLPLPMTNETTCGGYTQKPTRHFPTLLPQAKWVYITDVDNNIFRLFFVNYASRMFRLNNIPRWLFNCATVPSLGLLSTDYPKHDDGKHVFLDPVPSVYLPPSDISAQPDPTYLAHYHRCAPTLEPPYDFPSTDASSVRAQFRLVLLTIFHNEQLELFQLVKTHRSPFSELKFHELTYSMINLTRSRVDVHLVPDKGYSTPAEAWRRRNANSRLNAAQLATTDCWIDGVLVILDPDISTTENLHAAIGKAIQLSSTRTPAEPTRPTAIISSLTSLVLVYNRDGKISHTPNMALTPPHNNRPLDTVAGPGIAALFSIFYHPILPAAPISLTRPHLPFELCQNIFVHACPATRSALAASCRLFRAVAYDHGLRAVDFYLQKRAVNCGRTTFEGEVWEAGKYGRGRIVQIGMGSSRFGGGCRAVMRVPDAGVVGLGLPLLEVKEMTV